jgi:protein gp37
MGTAIEWTDTVWNPVTGCSKVSEGCRNCYAFELHDRRHKAYLEGKKLPQQYAKPFSEIQLFPERLEQPLKWRKPRRIFVNSMSDLFHEDVPFEFIEQVFATMALAKQHTFQILTKRPQRMLDFFKRCVNNGHLPNSDPLPNVWIGVTVENQRAAEERIPLLLQTPAAVRFLSCEPLLEQVDLNRYIAGSGEVCKCPACGYIGNSEQMFYWGFDLDGHPTIELMECPECGLDTDAESFGILPGVDWVITGGESGPNARPMHPDWVRSLRDQCQAAGVPFFFKQWGEWFPRDQWEYNPELILPDDDAAYSNGPSTHVFDDPNGLYPVHRVGKKKAGRLLDGREWNEFPNVI